MKQVKHRAKSPGLVVLAITVVVAVATTGWCEPEEELSELALGVAVKEFGSLLDDSTDVLEVWENTVFAGTIPSILSSVEFLVYTNRLVGEATCIVAQAQERPQAVILLPPEQNVSPVRAGTLVNSFLPIEGDREFSDEELLELVYLCFDLATPPEGRGFVIDTAGGKDALLAELRELLPGAPDSLLAEVTAPKVERVGEQRNITVYYRTGKIAPPVCVFTTWFKDGRFGNMSGAALTASQRRPVWEGR